MKTVDEIYQEMLESIGEKSKIQVQEGCDLSARLYAVAAQVFALSAQSEWVERQSFPQTAQGEYLDYHAQLRGLERKGAVQATGTISFAAETVGEEDRVIPAGTVCMTAGLVRFETTEEVTLPAGALTVEVYACALVAGGAGNVAAGTITLMAVAPVGIKSCVNVATFSGGGDEEGDEVLRARVLDTFLRLPNGANTAFYQQGALAFDEVAAATVLPRNRGIGTVDVVVATLGGAPEQSLLNELAEYFQQRREIAVDVQVLAPDLVPVSVTVGIQVKDNTDFATVSAVVEETLRGHFNGALLGNDVLLAKLGSLIYGCEGVKNYAITAPEGDVAISAAQLPRLGTLIVEEMA